jgi:hypothetical protein
VLFSWELICRGVKQQFHFLISVNMARAEGKVETGALREYKIVDNIRI